MGSEGQLIMAYNNYFPATYQPNYYGQPNPYYQQMLQQSMIQQAQAAQAQQQMQQHTPTIQQSGFVLVQSEQEARAYPVAPGNSITFKDERQPYCYVKTMGFNQLDQPTFERYRLVKEDTPLSAQNATTNEDSTQGNNNTTYALKSDLNAIWGEIDAIKNSIKSQAEKKIIKVKKEEPDQEAKT